MKEQITKPPKKEESENMKIVISNPSETVSFHYNDEHAFKHDLKHRVRPYLESDQQENLDDFLHL